MPRSGSATATATSPSRAAAARSGAVAGSLEQLAHGLRDLDRERGLYVSQVSHDLRNPLAVIGVYASVLRQGERSRPRAARLQTIEDEASRLAVMVDDLLELGRTHALALHIQRAPADVSALVADAVTAARARSGRRASSCSTRGPLPAARRRCAAPAPGTRQPARERRPARAQRGARRGRRRLGAPSSWSCVEDDGPGIERELLPRLFDAFAQGASATGGAGMGLSTVRAIAEAHGGGVSVGVAPAGGARFTLRLPLAPAETVAP